MQYPASIEPGPIQSSDPPSEATLGYHLDPDLDGAPERVRFNTGILTNNAISGLNWARAHSELRSALRGDSRIPLGSGSARC